MSRHSFIALAFSALTAFSAPLLAANSPETIVGANVVDASKAKELFENEVLFVDVRKDSDWEAGRVPGAVHLELKSVFSEESLLEEMAKDEAVVIYCNGIKCLRSAKAVELAVSWGFSDVYYFRDGFPSWTAAGMPVE